MGYGFGILDLTGMGIGVGFRSAWVHGSLIGVGIGVEGRLA